MHNYKHCAGFNVKRRIKHTFHFLLKNLQYATVKMWICDGAMERNAQFADSKSQREGTLAFNFCES